MKIGVISHTRTLATEQDLPAQARLALADVDLVLHTGNVGELTFLKSLQDRFGLTFAVYGQQDSDEAKRFLEADKVVEFANRRIGMVFATPDLDTTRRLPGFKRQSPTNEALAEALSAYFANIDCVLFGHPTKPLNYIHQGILIFNPGPIITPHGTPGSMGILQITDRAMTGRIVLL